MIKHQYPERSLGFTLIELIVVIAIMSTVYSLIGPNILKSLDKVKVQSEIRELKDVLKKISYKAFVNGREVQVKFSGNKIEYFYRSATSDEVPARLIIKSFKLLSFPLQTLNYTSAGFTDLTNLNIHITGELRYLSLVEINSL